MQNSWLAQCWQTRESQTRVEDLLTTRQLQELLQVDRITIYRMLDDDRLHGFKVGGQWRFLRREVESWLRNQGLNGSPAPAAHAPTPASFTLPLTCIQAIQDILAEACQVAALTLDPTGQPLTTLSNSSALCTLILASTEGRRRCAACWQGLAHGQAGRCPQPTLCHAGLSYLVVPVTTQVVGQRVATLAVGQIWTEPCTADLPALAQACALDLTAVQQAAAQMPCSSAEHLARVGRLAERTAAAFAEIGQERWRLLSRLQSIAEMTVVE